MGQSILQLSLAIAPALIASLVIKRVTLPWENERRPSERAELLLMLAKDVRDVKSIMARNIKAVNHGRACALPSLPLLNWKRLKKDARLKKYSNERIFKAMIRQFREWEGAANGN